MNVYHKLTKEEARVVMRSLMEKRARVTPNRHLPNWVLSYWNKVTS